LGLLGEGGLLFFEVNRNKGEEVRAMLYERGYRDVELRSDMAGNPRMVRAIKQ
jgi:release factor glutamine methyltransferase